MFSAFNSFRFHKFFQKLRGRRFSASARPVPWRSYPPANRRTTAGLILIETGQGGGICTRTVRITGGANYYITTCSQFRFQAEAIRRPKHEVQLPDRSNANAPARFITSPIKKLTLKTQNRFHAIPFVGV